MMKNRWMLRMDKVLAALLVIGPAVFFIVASGCSTQPMPNINIGGADSCPPSGGVTLTIVNGNDKSLMGDKGVINDDDGGQTPSLGL